MQIDRVNDVVYLSVTRRRFLFWSCLVN